MRNGRNDLDEWRRRRSGLWLCTYGFHFFFFFAFRWKEFFSSTRIVKAAKVSQDERWRLSSFNPLPISIMSPAHWQPPHPTAAANCLPPRPTVRQFFFLLRLFEQCFHLMPSAEINSIPRVERVRFGVFFCLGNV